MAKLSVSEPMKMTVRRPRRARRADRPSYGLRGTGQRWCADLMLSNRRRLTLRPIEPADAPALIAAFSTLSPEDVRMRFLHPVTGLTREQALRNASPDPRRELVLVLSEPEPPGQALIGAVARAIVVDPGDCAEFALVLGQPLRGYGLGELLLRRLVEWARRKRLASIFGDVLAENGPMLALAAKLGFRRDAVQDEAGVLRLRLPLRAPAAASTP